MSDSLRILALAPNLWRSSWMNRQQILSRLAKRHQIIYSNGPWSVWDRHLPEFVDADWLGGFEPCDGVWLDRSPKALLSWPNRAAWDLITTPLVVDRWHRQLKKLGDGPVVAYVFHPTYLRYVEQVRADLVVYSPFDLFSKMPDWSEENEADEQRMLELCSIVITSSDPTRKALREKTDKPIYCVPNAADARLFESGSKQPPPSDLAAVPRPRIGYVGSLNRKVDFSLIHKLALREPSWNFVFIGPIGSFDEVTRAEMEQCRELANVYFLRARPFHDLPMCMGALDVALLCYRKDTWMEFGYPLKLHEYLASGAPIVSTPLESIRDCRDFIETADDEESWRMAIERALNGSARSTPERRRALARQNTWEERVAVIEDILVSALDGKLQPRTEESLADHVR